ncbi:MAG: intradiol ring-cleavage dioxygenase [Pseudomonadota bacterium]
MRNVPGNDRVNRRRLLAGGLAVVGAAALGVGKSGPAAAATQPRLPLTARATEGPYYLGAALVRADITEGVKGVPLELRLRVLDEDAATLAGLRVDVWHCDSQGNYSGFDDRGDAQGRTRRYLRGTQSTDSAGNVAFRTIYPGWYSGRTTHIHFKVLEGSRALLTSQLFLPDAISQFLYAKRPEYRRKAARDTLNSNDGISLAAGSSLAAAVRELGDSYTASLDIVVARTAA